MIQKIWLVFVAAVTCLVVYQVGMRATGTPSVKNHRTVVPTPIYRISPGETKFPVLVNARIPGAPKLGPPILVVGIKCPLLTEKHGLAAPAVFDWNGDGKKDLLVGEFETGATGSNIRVYFNVGSNAAPSFTDDFEYAKDTSGDSLSVAQWLNDCFSPQFVDLNDDGYPDMISGQFNPSQVTWFRGGPNGFRPGSVLPRAGDLSHSFHSAASFGDFDNDGDQDLITGGSDGLCLSENIGTPRTPKFSSPNQLLDVDGKPLGISIDDQRKLEVLSGRDAANSSDDWKTSPLVTDWDNDGVLDLLVTNSYSKKGHSFVDFFRGVKTQLGHRFEPAVALFKSRDGSKEFPGSCPRIFVSDWNNDGVNDLVIGGSVVTVNGGEFHTALSWTFESETDLPSAGADFGRDKPLGSFRSFLDENWLMQSMSRGTSEPMLRRQYNQLLAEEEKFEREYADAGRSDWLTARHQGRVYVMLGKRRSERDVVAAYEYPMFGRPIVIN